MILVGVVVLLVHDMSDCTLIIARMYTDYKNRNIIINILLGIIMISNWIFCRNIMFPSCTIHSCFLFLNRAATSELVDIIWTPILYQTSMLCALAFMHCYWTLYILKGVYNMLFKGKDKNGYDS